MRRFDLHRFALHALPATPWKNGGGTTRELLSWPPGAGLDDFAWRVSVATIARDGAFSRFAGVQRQIMLLDGAGVALTGESVDHRLDTPLAPFAFDGERAVSARCLGGASSDFNVMARRAMGRATVEVVRAGAALSLHARHALVLALHGGWQLRGAPAELRLQAGEGVWWAGQAVAATLAAEPPAPSSAPAAAVVVRWHPAEGLQ